MTRNPGAMIAAMDTAAAAAAPSLAVWLTPTLIALFLYGLGQGLVKKYAAEVSPARYCLYFWLAKSLVNLFWWAYNGHPNPFGNMTLVGLGTLAYVLEGIGWICYYESIVSGPITIVGTLSAAYAAPTVLFLYLFLGEKLVGIQYAGVALVILGCAGLSYSPPDPDAKVTDRRWIPLAITALIVWGLWNTLVKYCYDKHAAVQEVMSVYNVFGAGLTLGLYGFLFRGKAGAAGEFARAALPMAVMAGGDLAVIVAYAVPNVRASLVTTISGAYPIVTLFFATTVLKEKITPLQWVAIALCLAGMFLSMS